MKKNKSTFVKLLKRIKKHSFFIILSLIMAAVTVATTLYVPILVGRGIDCIIGVDNVDFAKIVNILIRIGIFVGITALSQWLMNICNNRITYEVTRDIRNEAIEKIQVLPLKYIDGHSYGEIVSRVIADVDQFADGLLMGFTQFFTGVMTILGTLIFMITINAKITLAVVVITPLSFLVASFIARKTFSMFKLQSETRGEQTALIDEMIGGQKVVKAYGYEDEAVRKFDEINERLQKYSLKAIFFSSITNPSTRFVNSLVYASVAIVGAFSAINGGITVGQLSSFLSYANQYTKPFNEISGVVTELQNALACAARIFELIEEANNNGTQVIITAAGMAAALPGVVASQTVIPVIGVPISGSVLDGMDALLSIVQMPSGIPVATVAINGSKNAAYLALQIIGNSNAEVRKKLLAERESMEAAAMKANAEVIAKYN